MPFHFNTQTDVALCHPFVGRAEPHAGREDKKVSCTAAIDSTGVSSSDLYVNNPQEHFHFHHQMSRNAAMIISTVGSLICVCVYCVEPALKDFKKPGGKAQCFTTSLHSLRCQSALGAFFFLACCIFLL